MSANPRIQKLEALLSRITTRAAEPRHQNVAASSAVAVQTAADPSHLPNFTPGPVPSQAANVPPGRISEARVAPEPMRRAAMSSPELTVESTEEYIDAPEVEVSTEVVEVDVDEAGNYVAAGAHAPHAEEEEAPASSKRPITEPQEEESAADAYADAPRHTPPPESGPQVSPGPAIPPESTRRASVPPSADVGGWREPGLTDARRQPSIPPAPPVQPAASRVAPAPPAMQRPQSPAQPSSTGPTAAGVGQVGQPAQIMRPQIAHSTEVAKIEGSVQATEASTFGDLLDTTLSI